MACSLRAVHFLHLVVSLPLLTNGAHFDQLVTKGQPLHRHSSSPVKLKPQHLAQKGTPAPLLTFRQRSFSGKPGDFEDLHLKDGPGVRFIAGFSIAFTARWDNLGVARRVIDFGNGAGAPRSNIVLGNKAGTHDLEFTVFRSGVPFTLEMKGILREHETHSFLCTVTTKCQLQCFMDGSPVGSLDAPNCGVAQVARNSLLVGGSAGEGETTFQGELASMCIWDREVSTEDAWQCRDHMFPKQASTIMLRDTRADKGKADKATAAPEAHGAAHGRKGGGKRNSCSSPGSGPVMRFGGKEFSGRMGDFAKLKMDRAATLDCGAGFSVSFTASWRELGNKRRVVLFTEGNDGHMVVASHGSTNDLVFAVCTSAHCHTLQMNGAVEIHQDHRYLCGVSAMGELRCFRDGELIGYEYNGHFSWSAAFGAGLYVGKSNLLDDAAFAGRIGHVCIWDHEARWEDESGCRDAVAGVGAEMGYRTYAASPSRTTTAAPTEAAFANAAPAGEAPLEVLRPIVIPPATLKAPGTAGGDEVPKHKAVYAFASRRYSGESSDFDVLIRESDASGAFAGGFSVYFEAAWESLATWHPLLSMPDKFGKEAFYIGNNPHSQSLVLSGCDGAGRCFNMEIPNVIREGVPVRVLCTVSNASEVQCLQDARLLGFQRTGGYSPATIESSRLHLGQSIRAEDTAFVGDLNSLCMWDSVVTWDEAILCPSAAPDDAEAEGQAAAAPPPMAGEAKEPREAEVDLEEGEEAPKVARVEILPARIVAVGAAAGAAQEEEEEEPKVARVEILPARIAAVGAAEVAADGAAQDAPADEAADAIASGSSQAVPTVVVMPDGELKSGSASGAPASPAAEQPKTAQAREPPRVSAPFLVLRGRNFSGAIGDHLEYSAVWRPRVSAMQRSGRDSVRPLGSSFSLSFSLLPLGGRSRFLEMRDQAKDLQHGFVVSNEVNVTTLTFEVVAGSSSRKLHAPGALETGKEHRFLLSVNPSGEMRVVRDNTLLAKKNAGIFTQSVLAPKFSLVLAKSLEGSTGFSGFVGEACLWDERVYWTAAEYCGSMAKRADDTDDTLQLRYDGRQAEATTTEESDAVASDQASEEAGAIAAPEDAAEGRGLAVEEPVEEESTEEEPAEEEPTEEAPAEEKPAEEGPAEEKPASTRAAGAGPATASARRPALTACGRSFSRGQGGHSRYKFNSSSGKGSRGFSVAFSLKWEDISPPTKFVEVAARDLAVTVSNVVNDTTLSFQIAADGELRRWDAPRAIVPGKSQRFLLAYNARGHVRIFCDGENLIHHVEDPLHNFAFPSEAMLQLGKPLQDGGARGFDGAVKRVCLWDDSVFWPAAEACKAMTSTAGLEGWNIAMMSTGTDGLSKDDGCESDALADGAGEAEELAQGGTSPLLTQAREAEEVAQGGTLPLLSQGSRDFTGDGDDFVNLAATSSVEGLDAENGFTIYFEAQWSDVSSIRPLVNFEDASGYSHVIVGNRKNSTTMVFLVHRQGATYEIDMPDAIQVDEVGRFLCTLSADGAMSVYKDGELLSYKLTPPVTENSWEPLPKLFLGRASGTVARNFKGYVGNLCVWDEVLSWQNASQCESAILADASRHPQPEAVDAEPRDTPEGQALEPVEGAVAPDLEADDAAEAEIQSSEQPKAPKPVFATAGREFSAAEKEYADLSLGRDPPSFNLHGGFSVSFEARWDDITNGVHVVDFGNSSRVSNLVIGSTGNTTKLVFYVGHEGAFQMLAMPGVVAIGEKHSFLCTFVPAKLEPSPPTSGVMSCYKDGELISDGTHSMQLPEGLITWEHLYLAKSHWDTDGYFNGFIGSVCFWERVVTPQEATGCYEVTAPKAEVAEAPAEEDGEEASEAAVPSTGGSADQAREEVELQTSPEAGSPSLMSAAHEFNAEQGHYVALSPRGDGSPMDVSTGFSIAFDARWDDLQEPTHVVDFSDDSGIEGFFIGASAAGESGATLSFSYMSHRRQQAVVMDDVVVQGEQHRYLCTLSIAVMRCYQDGNLIGEGHHNVSLGVADWNKLYLGRSRFATDGRFSGMVSNMCFWEKEITWSEARSCQVQRLRTVFGSSPRIFLRSGGSRALAKLKRGEMKAEGTREGQRQQMRSRVSQPNGLRPPIAAFSDVGLTGKEDSGISLPIGSDLNGNAFGEAFSVSFIARWDALRKWSRVMELVSADGKNNLIVANEWGSANLAFHVYENGNPHQMSCPNQIQVGETAKFLCTANYAGEMRCYKDGKLICYLGGNFKLPKVSRPTLLIGKSSWAEDENFMGRISNLCIWDHVVAWQEAINCTPMNTGLPSGSLKTVVYR